HDVAGLQHGADRGWRAAEASTDFRPRPFHLVVGNDSSLTLLDQHALRVAARPKPDRGLVLRHVEHHGKPPGFDVAPHRDSTERLAPIALDVDRLHRPAPTGMAVIVGYEPIHERRAGNALEAWVERGADRKPAAIKLVLAEAIDDVAPHLLGEELGSEDLGPGRTLGDTARRRFGSLALIARGKAILDDAVDDPVAASDSTVRVPERVVVARRLGQGGEIGAVGEGQLGQRLVPIGLSRGGNAVTANPEIDLVQIKLENLLLGEGALDADGKDRFLQLSLHGLLVAEQEVLGHLLSDGRGAYHAPSRLHRAQIGDDGAQDALNVETAMLIEILVLGGDEGLSHAFWNHRDRYVDAAL